MDWTSPARYWSGSTEPRRCDIPRSTATSSAQFMKAIASTAALANPEYFLRVTEVFALMSSYVRDTYGPAHTSASSTRRDAAGWSLSRLDSDDPSPEGFAVKYQVSQEGYLVSCCPTQYFTTVGFVSLTRVCSYHRRLYLLT